MTRENAKRTRGDETIPETYNVLRGGGGGVKSRDNLRSVDIPGQLLSKIPEQNPAKYFQMYADPNLFIFF